MRASHVIWYLLEFNFCYWFMWYLIISHMFPIAESAAVHFRNRDYLGIAMSTLHMAVPACYMWLVIFYNTFHTWLNFLAELT